jgi:hypothetical protein
MASAWLSGNSEGRAGRQIKLIDRRRWRQRCEVNDVAGEGTGSGGELLADRVGGIFLVLANVFDDVGIG